MKKKRTAKGKHHRTKGKTEREREREGERGGEWESRESFRHRAATASAASWLRNEIRNRRCPSLLFFIPIPPTILPAVSYLWHSVLFSGHRLIGNSPRASSLMPHALCHVPGMPRAPTKPHPVAGCLFDLVLAALLCCCFVFLSLSSFFFAVLFPFAIDVPVAELPALFLLLLLLLRSGNFFSAVVCILIRQKAARTVTGSTANTFVCHLCAQCMYFRLSIWCQT